MTPSKLMIVFTFLMCSLLPGFALAQSDVASLAGKTQIEVTVGDADTALFLKELQQKHPHLKGDISSLRKEMAEMEFGDKLTIELEIYNGRVDHINWAEVGVGVGLGLLAAVAWQWFGAEALCLVGVAPACVCVGPQC